MTRPCIDEHVCPGDAVSERNDRQLPIRRLFYGLMRTIRVDQSDGDAMAHRR